MGYTSEKPRAARSREELAQTIHGWGVDLDPAVRPSVPKQERQDSGAHWEFPERQPELAPRERSTEHKFLTPVFGTAQPLRGLSGAIRRYAYENYSEARAAHWLLLMLGDRIDVLESRITAVASGRPDNVFAETGIGAEFRNHAYRTRFGQHRADLKHQPLDLVMWAAPYAAIAGGIYLLAQGMSGARSRRGGDRGRTGGGRVHSAARVPAGSIEAARRAGR